MNIVTPLNFINTKYALFIQYIYRAVTTLCLNNNNRDNIENVYVIIIIYTTLTIFVNERRNNNEEVGTIL